MGCHGAGAVRTRYGRPLYGLAPSDSPEQLYGEYARCYGSLLLGEYGTRCLAEHASLSYGEVCAL